MKEEDAENTVPVDAPEAERLPFCKVYETQYQGEEDQKHHGAAYESLLLTHGTEDEVGILLRNIFQFGLRAIEESFTLQTA